ncbi:MAG TPA: hypothetical protein VEI95_17585 [Acidobacteriota bacterium]|nr:hypothetical protein [Acidobacteriota bacterium]
MKLHWVIIARMDQERSMEEILEEIRRMCADEERATDREVEAAVRAFERLAPSPKRHQGGSFG